MVIHKKRKCRQLGCKIDMSLCDKITWGEHKNNTSNIWKNVTCKNCLRKRK